MRLLVTWGSKRGGTVGIGQMLAAALGTRGIDVVASRVESDAAQRLRVAEPDSAANRAGAG